MSLEWYFKLYEMSQERRVRFTAMKLVEQAEYYWSNVERFMVIRRQEYVRTWEEMRAKLNQKYHSIALQDQQLDKWSRLNQKNWSAAEYIEIFDELLTWCSRFVDRSLTMTLSRFMSDFRENLHRELFAWGVGDLEHAYQIVRDLKIKGHYAV